MKEKVEALRIVPPPSKTELAALNDLRSQETQFNRIPPPRSRTTAWLLRCTLLIRMVVNSGLADLFCGQRRGLAARPRRATSSTTLLVSNRKTNCTSNKLQCLWEFLIDCLCLFEKCLFEVFLEGSLAHDSLPAGFPGNHNIWEERGD